MKTTSENAATDVLTVTDVTVKPFGAGNRLTVHCACEGARYYAWFDEATLEPTSALYQNPLDPSKYVPVAIEMSSPRGGAIYAAMRQEMEKGSLVHKFYHAQAAEQERAHFAANLTLDQVALLKGAPGAMHVLRQLVAIEQGTPVPEFLVVAAQTVLSDTGEAAN